MSAFWVTGQGMRNITVTDLDATFREATMSAPQPDMILVHPSRWSELLNLKRTVDWFAFFLPRQWFMKSHWSNVSKRKQQKIYVRWCWNEAIYCAHIGLTPETYV